MKKYSSLILIVFLLSSCQAKLLEDPQTMLDKAWKKQIEKQENRQKGTLDYVGNVKLSFDKNEAELSGKGQLAFDTASGDKKVALQIDANGNGAIEGKNASIGLKAETRFVDKKMFVNLATLNLKTDEPQVNLMANLVGNYYQNQWVEIPFDLFQGAGLSLVNGSSLNTLKLKEVAIRNPILEVKKDLGKRTLEVAVNPKKLEKYIDDIASVEPSASTPESKAALLDFFSNTNYTATVRISKKYDFEWIRLEGMSIDPENEQSVNLSVEAKIAKKYTEGKGTLEYQGSIPGTLSFQFKTTDRSKNAVVKAPEDAQPFDLGSLLGGGLGTSDESEE